MTIQQQLINHYCQQNSNENSELLISLETSTNLSTVDPTMISEFAQGRLLSMISCLLNPSNILEIGTFVGYSTICLSEGLKPDGKIVTIEKNQTLNIQIEKNLKTAGISKKVDLRIGSALEILPNLDLNCFQLVFIDAAKKEYQRYFDMIISAIEIGSVVIVDNVLWKGQVVQSPRSKIAQSLHEFNMKINKRKDIKNFVLPFRDGLNIITKI